MSRFADTLERLAATIAARKGADPASSYTAKLLAGGPALAAKKFGEEAVETVIAAVQGDPAALAAESADVIYHWLVLLAAAGVSLDEVAAKLEAREGRSGLEEKASRPKG
jgi:phosphoribosyl-ATP pyrophosphohydrolase